MKRLVLFVVALVFAFCTTVMAADQPMPAGTAAPAKKEMKAKKMKKEKKAAKKAARIKKEENVPATAPGSPEAK